MTTRSPDTRWRKAAQSAGKHLPPLNPHPGRHWPPLSPSPAFKAAPEQEGDWGGARAHCRDPALVGWSTEGGSVKVWPRPAAD
jgi:hypothetical protein